MPMHANAHVLAYAIRKLHDGEMAVLNERSTSVFRESTDEPTNCLGGYDLMSRASLWCKNWIAR
jgi:hypothetical protein